MDVGHPNTGHDRELSAQIRSFEYTIIRPPHRKDLLAEFSLAKFKLNRARPWPDCALDMLAPVPHF